MRKGQYFQQCCSLNLWWLVLLIEKITDLSARHCQNLSHNGVSSHSQLVGSDFITGWNSNHHPVTTGLPKPDFTSKHSRFLFFLWGFIIVSLFLFFSLAYCIVCHSSIYRFWLPLWYCPTFSVNMYFYCHK